MFQSEAQHKFINWGLMMTYATILVVGFVVSAFLVAFYWSVGSIKRVEPMLADYGQNPSPINYLFPLSDQIVAAARRDWDGDFLGNQREITIPTETPFVPTVTPTPLQQVTSTLQPSATQHSTSTATRTSSPSPTVTFTPTVTKTVTKTAPAPSATPRPTEVDPTRPVQPTATRSDPKPSATQAPRPTQPPPTKQPKPTATEDSYPPPRPTDPPPTAYP